MNYNYLVFSLSSFLRYLYFTRVLVSLLVTIHRKILSYLFTFLNITLVLNKNLNYFGCFIFIYIPVVHEQVDVCMQTNAT